MTGPEPTASEPTTARTERATLEDLEETPHARVFDGEPMTIRLALDADEGIAAHRHPDRRIVLHLLEGRLEVTLGGDGYAVEAGDLVRFDGDQDIAPKALEDSTAVLVLTRRAD